MKPSEMDSNNRSQNDPMLEDVQAWLAEPAPGMERLEALEVPALPRRGVTATTFRSRRPVRQRLYAVAGIAAVFVLGFALGRQTTAGAGGEGELRQASAPVAPVPTDVQAASEAPALTEPEVAPEAPATAVQVAPAEVTPAAPVRKEESGRVEVATVPIRQSQSADGKLIIETQLAQSGGRATWFVDPRMPISHESTR